MYHEFIRNSERYTFGNYDSEDYLNIDLNNLPINIETFKQLLEIIEYWGPYQPYPNEINIFFIELFKNEYNIENIFSYMRNKKYMNKIETYYNDDLLQSNNNIIIGFFVCNTELVNYVLDNSILDKNQLLIGTSAHNYLEVVKYLILNKADPSVDIGEALIGPAEYGYLDMINYLVSLGVNPAIRKNEILETASRYGHLKIVEYAINLGANIKSDNNYALQIAMEYNHLEIVKYLLLTLNLNLNKCKQLNIVKIDSLLFAVENGNLEFIKYLISKGVNIRTDNDYALCCAAEYGNLKIVEFLIKKGSSSRSKGNRALQYAVEYNRFEVVRYLLSLYFIDYNQALSWSIKKNYFEVVKYLVKIGANLNSISNKTLKYINNKCYTKIKIYLAEKGIHIKNNI